MKKKIIAIILGLCILGSTACGKTEAESHYDPKVPKAITHFGYRMYEQQPEDTNLFFSPYSIVSALSLLDLGAEGNTKAELENALGIEDLSSWNGHMNWYREEMKRITAKNGKKLRLLSANSLWISKDLGASSRMEKEFVKPAESYYGADVFSVDFVTDAAKTVKAVNKWVEDATKGMITEYKESIDPDTALMLLNTVYFEGKWKLPFREEKTKQELFHGQDGGGEVPVMNLYRESFRYVEQNGIKGIELPYVGERLVMNILLPADGSSAGIDALYRTLTDEEKDALWEAIDTAEPCGFERIAIPRFTMDRTMENMKTILQTLGMSDLFAADADLDIINEDVYVSEILHRARIEVEEQGTRAAAITEITLTGGAAPGSGMEFIADKPFLYAIRDKETGMLLFLGRVSSLPDEK